MDQRYSKWVTEAVFQGKQSLGLPEKRTRKYKWPRLSLHSAAAAGKRKALFSNTAHSLLIHVVSLQEQLGQGVELFILESGGNRSQNHTRRAGMCY